MPLTAVRNPLDALADLGLTLPAGGLLTAVLIAVFAVWLIYTLVISYHWLRYSHSSLITFPAIFVHLVVSVAIMSYALTGSPVPTFIAP
ncbi:hypothetical protein A3E65_00545 [Candidatus Kaiserbacteria bacterium RIFCSPHIGHO2_12_FULL_56_13]|uniref:Uncharacterized protein n=1 Tax=Candidatus Kaiserbacteria bacterium RIFCSPHIGHO2_12_FULL_56_13 TaxID=1798505 RepID=A0A1F6EF93_9BACT|nr:MAG: hypothetical protein A3E65_00545 [Candidatus Kaiserbacteria bacterium RIFCSPHIGHO2_12_FULL_56_13]